jgi:predicted alpha/beta-fold hydrolase
MVIFPGLGGDSESDYIKSHVDYFTHAHSKYGTNNKYAVAIINVRGLG